MSRGGDQQREEPLADCEGDGFLNRSRAVHMQPTVEGKRQSTNRKTFAKAESPSNSRKPNKRLKQEGGGDPLGSSRWGGA